MRGDNIGRSSRDIHLNPTLAANSGYFSAPQQEAMRGLDTMSPLERDFYDRCPILVARDLLGQLLVRRNRDGICIGRIVETEAYLAEGDPACHAHRGRSRKNATMFGPPGHLYVYPIHSRYCLNVVTEPANRASAVLIRALEPLQGMSLMARRRGVEELRGLARGPARLCEAFAVDRALDGWDLTVGARIWIAAGPDVPEPVASSVRVGVTSAADMPLRFFLTGNRFVSPLRLFQPAPRGVACS